MGNGISVGICASLTQFIIVLWGFPLDNAQGTSWGDNDCRATSYHECCMLKYLSQKGRS